MKQFCTTLLCTALFLIDYQISYANAVPRKSPVTYYDVRKLKIEPIFEIYEPYGMRVSIPMIDINMNEFEFHANVNELISMDEPGTLHGKAIFSHFWGQWSLFLNSARLNINDRLNYWYEVRVGDKKIRYQTSEPFVVQYRIPVLPDYKYYSKQVKSVFTGSDVQNSRGSPLPSIPDISKVVEQTASCKCDMIEKLRTEVDQLKSEIFNLNDNFRPIYDELNKIKLLTEAQLAKTADTSNKEIQLTSEKPVPGENALEDVRFIVTEKMLLSNLESKILRAKYNDCGILFEMESYADKKFLLQKAEEDFQKYHIKFSDGSSTECNSSENPLNDGDIDFRSFVPS